MEVSALTEAMLPDSAASPLAARLLVLGVGIGLFGGLCLYTWVMRARCLRRASAEKEAHGQANEPLRPGPATIAGEVLDDGAGPPVVVRIHQRGIDYSVKGSHRHDWIEERREVIVRAFKLVRPSGEAVRVEPHDRLLLVHPLDGLEGGQQRRVRIASLRAGTRVYVTGALARNTNPPEGSRANAASELLLRPPPGGRMVIASESLADYQTDKARRYRRVGLLALAVLLISHGVVFLRYDALALFGHVVEAPAVARRFDGRNYVTAGALEAPCSWRLFEDVRTGNVKRVPFLVAGPFQQVGRAASVPLLTTVFYPMFALAFLLFGTLPTAIGRRWWDFPRLVETGRGQLPSDSVMYQ
jgi:hypothetical protein